MFESENLYCKMFIDFDDEESNADELIAKITGGTIKDNWGLIEAKYAELDIRRNDDFKTPKKLRSEDPADEFLFWRYYLDIQPKEGTLRQNYIAVITQLLLALWARGIDAVAACSFEDELPRK